MISLILYGRNDSHGYNLHKRAAISLNAMAEVLRHPDDEIVFVDYNTPDDLPTFPEAIQDTLTERARTLTRVIRLRPEHHALFADRTHLPALEPVARNVALRRCNARNRWVLSTNTDMIFVLPPQFGSLGDVVADLEDGYYHLPRFELPEGIWESFDRRDPRDIIQRTARAGSAYHLDEVILGSRDVLFDAPGDFQLALRQDLLDIDGFHEEMILGWHVDANLGRRMRLLRGEIRSLQNRLKGYHCDHTRMATLVHRRGRKENDSVRFVDKVTIPDIPEQRATFGLPEIDFEEIDLLNPTGRRYVAALDNLNLEPAVEPYGESYVTDTYNRHDYEPAHVAPYVLDLLSSLKPDARIAYVGARPRMQQLLDRGIDSLLPGAERIAVADSAALGLSGSRQCSAAEWLAADADIYVFEIGSPTAEAQDEHARSVEVMSLFQQLTHTRKSKPVRVVAINAIHNVFEQLVTSAVNCTPTPFSTRVRHGYLVPYGQADASSAESRLAERISKAVGRPHPAAEEEVRRLIEIARRLVDAPEDAAAQWTARRYAGMLLALIQDPLGIGMVDRPVAALDQLGRCLTRNRETFFGSVCGIPVRAGMRNAGDRFAAVEDWDDPVFRSWASRFARLPIDDMFNRRIDDWERISILAELQRNGVLSEAGSGLSRRILLVSYGVDPMAAWLGGLGADVTTTEPSEFFAGGVCASGYDAVILFRNIALDVPAKAAALLARSAGCVDAGGLLIQCLDVSLDKTPRMDRLTNEQVASAGFTADLARASGCELARGADVALSPMTLDRNSRLGFQQDIFIDRYEGPKARLLTTWRRTEIAPDENAIKHVLDRGRPGKGPSRLERLLRGRIIAGPESHHDEDILLDPDLIDLAPGETLDLTDRMSLKPHVIRGREGGLHIPAGHEGHAIFGPYVRLAKGAWELVVHTRPGGIGPLRLEIFIAPKELSRLDLSAPRREATLGFTISSRQQFGRVEFRCGVKEMSLLDIERITLRRGAP